MILHLSLVFENALFITTVAILSPFPNESITHILLDLKALCTTTKLQCPLVSSPENMGIRYIPFGLVLRTATDLNKIAKSSHVSSSLSDDIIDDADGTAT